MVQRPGDTWLEIPRKPKPRLGGGWESFQQVPVLSDGDQDLKAYHSMPQWGHPETGQPRTPTVTIGLWHLVEVDGTVLPAHVSGALLWWGWCGGLLCFWLQEQEGALDSAGAQRSQGHGILMQLSTAGHADIGFVKAQTVPAVCVSAA